MNNTYAINELIKSDCKRYCGRSDKKSILKTKHVHAAFKYTTQYRRAYKYVSKKKSIRYYWHRYKLLKLSKKYGYQIGLGVEIGPGFYMGHRGTVIINKETKIGSNVNIAVGVTIGQENRGERQGVPTIGNKVWIGTNAVIVGKINIGDNVLIAPNAYVNFDVPSDSIVVGNPAKIISNKEATVGYIQHPYGE